MVVGMLSKWSLELAPNNKNSVELYCVTSFGQRLKQMKFEKTNIMLADW